MPGIGAFNWLSAALLTLALLTVLRKRSRITPGLLAFTQPVVFLAACLTLTPFSSPDRRIHNDSSEFHKPGGLIVAVRGAILEQSPEQGITIGNGAHDVLQVANSAPDVLDLRHPRSALKRDGNTQLIVAAMVDGWDPSSLPRTTRVINGLEICTSDGAAGCLKAAPRWKVTSGHLTVSLDGTDTYAPACSLPHEHIGNQLHARFLGWPDATEQIFPLATYGRKDCRGPALSAADDRHDVTQGFFHYSKKGTWYFSLAGDAADTRSAEAPSRSGMPAPEAGWGDGVKISVPPEASQELQPADSMPRRGANYRASVYRANLAIPRDEPVLHFPWITAPASEIGLSRLELIREFRIQPLTATDSQPGIERIRVELVNPAITFLPASSTCTRELTIPIEGQFESARGGTLIRVPFLKRLADVSPLGAQLQINRSPSLQGEQSGCAALTKSSIAATGSYGFIDDVGPRELIELGTPDGQSLLVSVAEMSVPFLPIIGLLGAISLLRLLIRVRDRTWLDSPTLTIVTLVDVLLILRVLAAMQEFSAAPSLRGSVAGSLVAALVVPTVVEFLAVYTSSGFRPRLIFLLLCACIVGTLETFVIRGAIPRHSVEYWVPALVAYGLAAVILSIELAKALGPAQSTPWVTQSVNQALRYLPLVRTVPLFHLLLVTVGLRERLSGIGISAIFVPLYVVSFSVLLDRFSRDPRFRTLVVLLTLGLALPAAAFVAAHDTGSVIYLGGMALLLLPIGPRVSGASVSPLALILGWIALIVVSLLFYGALFWYLGVESLIEGFSHSAAAIILISALVAGFIAFWSVPSSNSSEPSNTSPNPHPWLRFLSKSPPFVVILILVWSLYGSSQSTAAPCGATEISKLASCFKQTDLQTNQLRLSRIFAPDRGNAEYSREALGMNAVFDEMRWLSSDAWGGLAGRGFLTVPPRQGLDAYDGAPALHILGPFGRSTAAVLMLWFFIAVRAAYRSAEIHRFDLPSLVRLTAMTVFAFVSGYMILANLELVPFTGRNVYFLAAHSQTDLLEGTLLVLLAVCIRSRNSADQQASTAK